VDKNGKRTTVRKKTLQRAASPRPLPTPEASESSAQGLLLGDDVAWLISNGDVNARDVTTVGAAILSDSNDRRYILRALVEIKRGDKAYDTQQLRDFFEATKTEIGYAAAIQLADAIGMDRALTLKNKLIAFQSIDNMTKWAGVPEDRLFDALVYQDTFHTPPSTTYMRENMQLFMAGVSAETAELLLSQGMSYEAILAAHAAGIHSAVAEGWL
jgi:hypothetical protein